MLTRLPIWFCSNQTELPSFGHNTFLHVRTQCAVEHGLLVTYYCSCQVHTALQLMAMKKRYLFFRRASATSVLFSQIVFGDASHLEKAGPRFSGKTVVLYGSRRWCQPSSVTTDLMVRGMPSALLTDSWLLKRLLQASL